MPSPSRSGDPSPFRFDGDRRGILLVHGFLGTPFEMRPLGEHLVRCGYSVVGVQLPGHGLEAANLRSTTWHDWYRAVERAFDELRARCDTVGVCGQSMGGLLTLELARRRGAQVTALATLAAALWLKPFLARGIRKAQGSWLWRRFDIPRLFGSDLADKAMKRANPSRGGMPIAALGNLLDCMDAVTPRLAEIDRPSFIAHALHDHTIPYACADHLAAQLRGPVERLTLERSFHVISLDVEREELYARLDRYFDARLRPPAPDAPSASTR